MSELRLAIEAALEAHALHGDGNKLARAVREAMASYPAAAPVKEKIPDPLPGPAKEKK